MDCLATVHFMISPNLTPHPNHLPKGEREKLRPLPLGEGWGEGHDCGLAVNFEKVYGREWIE